MEQEIEEEKQKQQQQAKCSRCETQDAEIAAKEQEQLCSDCRMIIENVLEEYILKCEPCQVCKKCLSWDCRDWNKENCCFFHPCSCSSNVQKKKKFPVSSTLFTTVVGARWFR